MNRATASMIAALMSLCFCVGSVASAQDYTAEFEDVKSATKLKLFFHESPNFVWVSGLNITQLGPTIKAAESAYTRFKDIADLGSWKDLWGRKKCLVVVGKMDRPHPGVLEKILETSMDSDPAILSFKNR